MIKIYYVIATAMVLSLCIVQNTYAQSNNTETNTTRSFMNCKIGSMKLLLSQMALSPPEIKFNLTDLTSPEVKQYVSDTCNFIHENSGVWLNGTDDELGREMVIKYGEGLNQKVKTPEIIKELAEAYIQLTNKTK